MTPVSDPPYTACSGKYAGRDPAVAVNQASAATAAELGRWRRRRLARCYPFAWLGKSQHTLRISGHTTRRTACTALGLDMAGNMQVLGIYVSACEGAGFWHNVLTDLGRRGVADVFIAVVDGLNGFPEATACLFPRTDVQLRILYQIRNSMKYVSPRHQKAFMADLKPVYDIYSTQSRGDSRRALDALEDKWGRHYPIAVQTWRNKWSNIATCFNYPGAIREIIYATNAIDSSQRYFRTQSRHLDAFDSESSLQALLLTAAMNTGARWSVPRDNWRETLDQLECHFGERLNHPA